MMMRPSESKSGSWELILADLALILFLVTLAALAGFGRQTEPGTNGVQVGADHHSVAPSQALYRPGPGVPALGEWLANQVRDPRATLTIFAQHPKGEELKAWTTARNLAEEAKAQGFAVRVIIVETQKSEPGEIYASLAFDFYEYDETR